MFKLLHFNKRLITLIIALFMGIGTTWATDYSQEYFTITSWESDNTITFYHGNISYTLYISHDKTNWSVFSNTPNTNSTVVLGIGEEVYFKANAYQICTTDNGSYGCHFGATKLFEASGNIMSLFNGDSFIGSTTFYSSNDTYGYNALNLFNGATTLLTLENLVLPATQYNKWIYQGFASGCTSLIKAPKELPAQTYQGRNTLVWMFENCTKLQESPVIRLTSNASGDGWHQMFKNCTSLKRVICLIQGTNVKVTGTNWLTNVPSGGVFYKKSSSTWSSGYNAIPSSWTTRNWSENSSDFVAVTSTPAYRYSCYVEGTSNYYKSGDIVTLKCTPLNNCVFNGWYVNNVCVSTNETYTFTATQNIEVTPSLYNPLNVGNINFADADVKALCVENWDVNGDGELNYYEAAAIPTLNNVFSFNDAITSFDELQYFTGLTSLNSYEFYFCSSLSSISLPNTVTLISDEAFSGCIGLSSITSLAATPPTLGNNVFDGVPNTVIVNVLSCSIDDYQSATGWNSFSNYDEIFSDSCPIPFADDNVKAICVANWDTNGDGELSYAEAVAVTDLGSYFQNNTTITSFDELQYFTALTSIGDYAFFNCSSLTSIEIPNSVTSIGQSAFLGCSSLTSIEIPNSVTSIGNYAFSDCSSLTSIEIPNSVTSIGTNPFGCSGLVQITVDNSNTVYDSRDNCNAIIETSTNVLITGCKNTVIPNSVTSIGNLAFSECGSLTSIEIPNSVTSIGHYAFSECSSLTSIEIPNSVTYIGPYAFSYCISLTSIEIPNSVTYIGPYACSYCISLTSILIYANTPLTVDNSTFWGVPSSTLVYVPCGTSGVYQSTSGWNHFSSFEEFITGDYCTIDFVDDNVKAICVAQWDTNGDGELSYAEAAAVTNLGTYFKNNTTITSFDELQYFTGVTTLQGMAFMGCTNLTSISLPSSMESLNAGTLFNCTSLATMTVYAETPPTVASTTFNNVPTNLILYVPCGTSAAYQAATGWSNFSNIVDMCTYHFAIPGSWSVATNWTEGSVPGTATEVIINANCKLDTDATVDELTINNGRTLTINDNKTLTVTSALTNNGSASNCIINDGGQLIHTNDVNATLKKNITAASSWSKDDVDGWYLIATPTPTATISTTFSGTYDLFKYDEASAYWWAYNGGHPFTYLSRGTGYLHASKTALTVSYTGSMISTEDTWTSPAMSYTSTLSDEFRGFNLMGNPFTRNLVEGDVKLGDETNIAYLTMNDTRTDFVTVNISDRPIKPGEGFFIQATEDGQTLVFNPTSKSSNNGYIRIVAGNENGTDNAYINVESGNTLRKFNMTNGTKVYVINEGQDFAAARIDELAGSMPVNFKAAAEGVYTITINAKNLEAKTMILIDNMTGEEIDLLATPSYTFKATPDDSYDRFRLIFDFNNYTGIEENFTGDIFAYQNGNEILINGEGSLEVYDVMGRMVLNTRINGVERVNVPANAVYIFKLNEKVQKIVVR